MNGIYLYFVNKQPSILVGPYLDFNIFLCPRIAILCAQTISDHNTIYIPCAILELSGTIPESADKVGIPPLRRTIPESSDSYIAQIIYM